MHFNFQNRGTEACGTVMPSRKDMPGDVHSSTLEKGQVEGWSMCSNSKIRVVHWKDKRDVFMITTFHNPQMVPTGKTNYRTGEKKMKPASVHDYNTHMGGVDLSDQMIGGYDAAKKTRRWYIKLFMHLIGVASKNAYLLYRKIYAKTTHLQFLLSLLDEMVQHYHSGLSGRGRYTAVDPPTRLTERHFPSLIPQTGKKKKPTRICRVCNAKVARELKVRGQQRIRKGAGKRHHTSESRYECTQCNVVLCVAPCFRIYHTLKEYDRSAQHINIDCIH